MAVSWIVSDNESETCAMVINPFIDVNPTHVMIGTITGVEFLLSNPVTVSQITCQLNFFLVGENRRGISGSILKSMIMIICSRLLMRLRVYLSLYKIY